MANSQKQPEDNSDKELQTRFEEEIKKPYYDVFYLDNFKLPYDKLDVSVVIPTYNRAPYKPDSLKGHLNPLAWAIESCLMQKPVIKEVIVVDDNSDDYTNEVVESFREKAKEKGIYLHYIRNKKHMGNSIARHIGSSSSNSKFLFFSDDDCVMPPYCIFGAVYTFNKLEDKGVNIAIVNLPTYSRTSHPVKTASKKEIGRLDFVRGTYTTNKNSFPLEYLENSEDKKFLDVELHILEPFSITNLNTFALCSKKAYEDVGGFKKQIIQRGLDREFGLQLVENGYSIYYQADPKFHCVHGSYGLASGQEFEGEDWYKKMKGMISLKKAMKECDKPAKDTGMRIDPKTYLTQQIISFFVLVYPRNKKGSLKWIKKVYATFVVKGDTSIFSGMDLKVPSEKERKEMWKLAINNGLKFIKKKELGELKKAEKIFKSLQEDKSTFEEAIKSISEL